MRDLADALGLADIRRIAEGEPHQAGFPGGTRVEPQLMGHRRGCQKPDGDRRQQDIRHAHRTHPSQYESELMTSPPATVAMACQAARLIVFLTK